MKKLTALLLVLAVFLFTTLLGGCLPEEEKIVREKEAAKTEKGKGEEAKRKKVEKKEKVNTQTITLYFSDDQAMHLLSEKRKIIKTAAVAKAAVEELIRGPQQAGHISTIPTGTKLLGIRIENGVAYVNFSKEFRQNHPGGSAGETMTIYSIVNTLTQFPTVYAVQFVVEGNAVDTLAGHMDLREPISRNEEIIKQQ